MDDNSQDEEMALRQGARLYPIGRALRASYDAENHESLGSDVAGLMINLSHVEPPTPAPPCEVDSTPPSLVGRMRRMLRWQ